MYPLQFEFGDLIWQWSSSISSQWSIFFRLVKRLLRLDQQVPSFWNVQLTRIRRWNRVEWKIQTWTSTPWSIIIRATNQSWIVFAMNRLWGGVIFHSVMVIYALVHLLVPALVVVVQILPFSLGVGGALSDLFFVVISRDFWSLESRFSTGTSFFG